MTDNAKIKLLLSEGLKSFGLDSICDPLWYFLLLLNKWNKAYNLTAIRDIETMISKHLFDSLAILPWIKGEKILDVGTGAGLPGIPLAIAKPGLQFVLLDSNGKKIRFLNEVKRQLNLKNLELIQIRVENYHPNYGFDTVISRAFSSLEQMINWTQHLIAQDGLWLAMKGRFPDTELATIHKKYQIERYLVQDIEGERCCVLINNTNKE
ncbi:ribosomal RNA small subunit methyltransferase G [Legionella norrlandica]|uniref:Ribosomal RNA small subunit methyltransferase G n=1 Tax=Legionella norrlandica TaxID=1498499 RepID=A0A0A2T9E9_9GAMM|nr:16S rRNA (guanine(527)-N(7))-methyltransferase RsmG [Legionella norrlandica]KGP64043.1 ribosomal RNA small subunit methyltransferase G [Legionella norrlandica]